MHVGREEVIVMMMVMSRLMMVTMVMMMTGHDHRCTCGRGRSDAFSRQNDIEHDDEYGGIMVNMVLCVIPGQGNSKILNLVNSGSFDSPIFLYIPIDEKTSTGHLI